MPPGSYHHRAAREKNRPDRKFFRRVNLLFVRLLPRIGLDPAVGIAKGLTVDDLLADFLTETNESLAELDVALVKLERTPDDAETLSG